jgi:hypothetical protein
VKYLDILSEGNRILARQRLFLPIWEGGNDMTSAFGTKEGAYVGSMSLCANYMAKIINNFNSLDYVQVAPHAAYIKD